MKSKTGRRKAMALVTGLALVGGLTLISQPAQAYNHTGCSWGPYGKTVTWSRNLPDNNYRTSANDAAYAWANATDVNSMEPSGGSMYGYLDNKGNNGYDGWTSWSCNGNKTNWAYVTLNPHYMDSKTYTQKRVLWLHEFGHGLGLGHSTMTTAMYYIPSTAGKTVPTADDINGINALY